MNPTMAVPSLTEVSTVVLRYKAALLLSFLVPVIASICISFVVTPKYEAVGRLLVQVGREYLPQPETAASGQSSPSISMKETVDTEVQIANSVDLMRDVVQAVTIERLYPALAATAPRDVSLESVAIRAFSKDLSVSSMRLTNVIEVALRNPRREVAEEALRVLMDRYRALHTLAFSQSRRPVLERQASENEALLSELQRQRADYATAHGLFSVAEQRSLLVQQRSRDLQELRNVAQRKLSIEAQIGAITAQIERTPATITLQSTSQNSPNANDAQKRARDLTARRQEFAARGLGPEFPAVAGLSAELASIQRDLARTQARDVAVTTGINPMANSLRTQLASLETDLAPLTGTIEELQANLAACDVQLRQLVQDEVQLRDYDRRISDIEATTVTTRQRLADARYADSLDRAEVGSVRVVQNPAISDMPVWPNKRLFAAAGVLLGMVASAFSLLIALTFGNHCLTIETVER